MQFNNTNGTSERWAYLLLREYLANLCHEQWSRRMEYLFEKGTFNNDGTWTMPSWAVQRWKLQASTSYNKLSKTEQDSARTEADRILVIVKNEEQPEITTG